MPIRRQVIIWTIDGLSYCITPASVQRIRSPVFVTKFSCFRTMMARQAVDLFNPLKPVPHFNTKTVVPGTNIPIIKIRLSWNGLCNRNQLLGDGSLVAYICVSELDRDCSGKAHCLTIPSHHLNRCWVTISKVQKHSSEGSFARATSAIDQ